ncbi:histidine kinase [Pseudoduganella sp. FT93W]|uniref:Histidine kinase n=1 Tax=Duganella fentianensis TaxID=2692177 RepID=A0A845HXA7_9BURK|nr:cache domain-containing protein [Duganella fentianensis]MYN45633.1 histidine kinase [Duganella fentianensis]
MKMFAKMLTSLLLIVGLGWTVPAAAQAQAARGTADDAVAMVKRAAAYLNKNGKDKAVAAFNDPAGEFVAGDLYVIMLDEKGVALAHGQNPRMVNKNLMEIMAGDVYPIKEMIKVGNSSAGYGWVKYQWPNSISKKMEAKSTYVERVGEYYLGVGVYH